MFQAITETLVLVLGAWGRFLKRHSLLGSLVRSLVSGVVVCMRRTRLSHLPVPHTRRFSRLRVLVCLRDTRRFSRLRLRQVRVSRCCRGGIRKSTAPRIGARRGTGITLFSSLATELISTSLAV